MVRRRIAGPAAEGGPGCCEEVRGTCARAGRGRPRYRRPRYRVDQNCSFVCFTIVLVIFLAAASCFLREQPKLRSLRGAVVSEPLDPRKVMEDIIFAIACVDGSGLWMDLSC